MEKDKLVKMRTALKAGKNLPLTIFIDNCFTVIDESNIGHFTFWDDENGILYDMGYADIIADKSPNDTKTVSMFAVEYESIQCMQLSLISLDDIDELFKSIKSTGKDVSADRIKNIKDFYSTYLDSESFNISRDKINELIGSNLNTNDDYYAGKLSEPFKETTRYRERNKEIDEANKDDN